MARKITNIKADKQTFAVWLNYWLEAYAKPNLTQSTFKGYRNMINNHIIPELGEKQMCELNTKVFQMFFNKKSVKDENDRILSQKSVKNIYDVMHVALQSAIEINIIKENHLDNIVMPKCPDREERFLCISEQEILLNYIDEFGSISAFGIVIMLETGIKKHELLLLKWSDIDYINHNIKLLNRVIPMTKSFYNNLTEYKEKQKKAMNEKNLVQTDDTYIISNNKFNSFTPDGYNQLIKRVANSSCLPFVTAEILRNTFGANCLIAGESIMAVSYAMGDSSYQVTNRRYKKLQERLKKAGALNE